MKKFIVLATFLILLGITHRIFACSPSFPALWPPSITSTMSTEHSVGITWSMDLPFIGDITAYRIYLNGAHVHTISPSITSLMFDPAGHGSYAVRNLQPNTSYNMAVGVVFAIPVGCGITWNVEMKSSASITTKPADWNHGAGTGSYSSIQNSSRPNAPVLTVNSGGINNVNFVYDVSGAYSGQNFEQENYSITKLFITVGSVCNSASFAGYQNSPYYEESYGAGYNIAPQNSLCDAVTAYKTEYVRTGSGYESKDVCRYVINHPNGAINKEITVNSNTGTVNITGLTGDTKYVLYGYVENSNGDISDESAPVFFTTPQGKTITTAPCAGGQK